MGISSDEHAAGLSALGHASLSMRVPSIGMIAQTAVGAQH